MTLWYVKQYLEETTIHGLRYVVERRSGALERGLWVLILLSSFALAGIMVASNLRDTAENPILTSINSISVQEIPFPAVTLSAAHVPTPQRLFSNALNRLEFDCFSEDGDCWQQTSKTREDFRPLILDALSSIRSDSLWLAESMPLEDARHIFCQDYNAWTGLRPVAVGLALAYDDDAVDNGQLRRELLDSIADSFREPFDYVTAQTPTAVSMTSVLERHGLSPSHLYEVSRYRGSSCAEEAGNFSAAAVRFAAVFLKTSGQADFDPRLIPFGEFLTLGSTHLLGDVFGQDPRPVQRELITNMRSWASGVMGKASNLSPTNALRYLTRRAFLYPDGAHNKSTSCVKPRIFQPKVAGGKEPVRAKVEYGDDWSDCGITPRDMPALLGLMKYMVVPPSRLVRGKAEQRDISGILEDLDYSPCHHWRCNANSDPAVVACKFGQGNLTYDCDLFAATFTNQGIGYTFNSAPFWTMYSNSSTNKAFYDQFHDTDSLSEGEAQTKEQHKLRNIVSNGRGYSLEVFVKLKHYLRSKDQDLSFNPSPLLLSLHDVSSVPDLRNEAIEVEPGMVYTINVVPSEVVTTADALRSMEPSRRRCMHTSDKKHNLLAFATYSHSACTFECLLRRATQQCNCTAWDYPVLDDALPLCEFKAAEECFERAMAAVIGPGECQCLGDCSFYQYSYSVTAKPVYAQICNEMEDFWYKLKLVVPNEFFTRNDVRGWTSDVFRCYQALANDIAVIRITIAPKTATQIVRSARVTFSGQLANLGGIMGLFSGMSLLSLAEIGFWMMKMVRHWIGHQKCPKVSSVKGAV